MKHTGKLGEVVRLEVGYQLRRPWTWAYFIALFAITFQVTMEAYTGNARTGGFFFNSPFVTLAMTLLATMMALVATAAIAGDAAARDVQTGMHPLVYTSPIPKGTFLGGRFLAAFFLNAFILVGVQLALLATTAMEVPPDLTGPFQPMAYLGSYVVVALPGAFISTALLFSLAALTRRAAAAYLGEVILFFGSMFVYVFLARTLGHWDLARLIDPMGMTPIGEISRAGTAGEKNALPVVWSAAMMRNRAIWLAVALVALAFTHVRFRFEHAVARAWWRRGGKAAAAVDATPIAPARTAPILVPRPSRTFGLATRLRQVTAIAVQSFREVAFGWGGLLLLGMAAIVLVSGPSLMSHMGVPLLPTTQEMVDFVGNTGEILWTIVPLLTVYYVGELVWRDRETGISEIADAAPVPEGVRYLGRLAGLSLVVAGYQLFLMLACILVQVQLGHYDFELPLYVRVMLGLQLAEHLLFVILAFTVHVVVNQKYAGHMLALAAYAVMSFGSGVGLEHKLLVYGASPDWAYTDMRGFGPTLGPWIWFKLYWFAWALLLGALTRVFWVRGREPGFRARLRAARDSFTGSAAGAALTALVLILAFGGFVFWNTNVLNEYRPAAESTALQAEYERTYGRYEGVPQPRLVGMAVRVEIHPDRGQAEIRGTYSLVNATRAAIDSIQLAPAWGARTGPAELDRASTLVLDDPRLGHRILALRSPLLPGDSLRLGFTVHIGARGFSNDGIDAVVMANGTFLDLGDWLPAIGYRAGREISGAGERADHGLPPEPAVVTLERAVAVQDTMDAERIAFEAIVGTAEGQTGVAPGALRRSWTGNGRAYFHYVTDVPISNDVAIYSARYAVRKAKWKDVEIEILHHPTHTSNLDEMIRSIQASLDYFTAHFGPYQHRQIRMVEEPDDGNSLHSAPVNISYEEGFAIFNPGADARKLEFPFAVVAHEVAHEWWGHQVRPVRAEGAGLMSESLAWYSAMAVVRQHYGDDQLRRLLDMMREAYVDPRARAGVPLLRAYDWFIGYRKGAFAMYALREYLGEGRINTALRSLVDTHRAGRPPLPTSLDLYRELQAVTPDSLRYLLVDLFEVNTFWNLEAKKATVEQAGNAWRVTLDVEAQKVAVDTAGTETKLPMNDLIEIGVYARGEGEGPGELLYQRLHRIRPGEQRITVTVSKEPAWAGIDPRRLLIDTETGDNVIAVGR
jgi:hypothetical protein